MTNVVVWTRLSSPINSEELCHQIEQVIEQELQFSTSFDALPGMALPVQVIDALIPSVQLRVYETLTDVERQTQIEIDRLTHLPLGQNGTSAVAMSLLIDENKQGDGVLILAAAPFVADEASLLMLLDRAASGREILPTEEEPLRFQHFSEWANEEIRATGQGRTQFWGEESHKLAISYIDLPCSTDAPQLVATGVILDDWLQRLTTFGTPEAVLLTAWGLIVGQFMSDEAESLTVSRLAAGRIFDDFAQMVGPFAGRAPITVLRDAATSVAEVIATVNQAIALHEDALIHYPDWEQPKQELSGATVGFTWIAAPAPRSPFCDVNVQPATIGGNLDLITEPMANGYRIRVVLYNVADNEGLAQRLVEAVVTAVKHMAEAPEAPFRSVPLMGYEEYQMVRAWNNTKLLFELPSSIPTCFRQIAAAKPTAVAVVDWRGELTFAELDTSSEHLAHELVARGIKRETPVAVLADRTRESIVLLLAIMKAGGVYVPIHPDFPKSRIAQILAAADIKIT